MIQAVGLWPCKGGPNASVGLYVYGSSYQ